jgi:hypothetical protein
VSAKARHNGVLFSECSDGSRSGVWLCCYVCSLELVHVGDNLLKISDAIIVVALLWQHVNTRYSGSGFVTYQQDGPRILSWRFTGELTDVWNKDNIFFLVLCKVWSQI